MGSWIGHIDEGIFFICLSVWWCYKIYTSFIENGCQERGYKPRASYSTRCGTREIPIEIVFKILFPVGGFLGELFDNGASLYDAEGNFRKLVYMLHMTIYGAFIVHGLLDLAEFFDFPLIKGTNYVSACLAFFWYGYGFYFHANKAEGKEPLENLVHLIAIPIMLLTGTAWMVESWLGEGHIWPQLVRAWCVLNLGTWFTQAAFVLFTPTSIGNPAWDQKDHRNVTAMVAIFGIHLILTLVFMVLMYTFTYMAMRLLGKAPRVNFKYKPVKGTVDAYNTSEDTDTCKLFEDEL